MVRVESGTNEAPGQGTRGFDYSNEAAVLWEFNDPALATLWVLRGRDSTSQRSRQIVGQRLLIADADESKRSIHEVISVTTPSEEIDRRHRQVGSGYDSAAAHDARAVIECYLNNSTTRNGDVSGIVIDFLSGTVIVILQGEPCHLSKAT